MKAVERELLYYAFHVKYFGSIQLIFGLAQGRGVGVSLYCLQYPSRYCIQEIQLPKRPRLYHRVPIQPLGL